MKKIIFFNHWHYGDLFSTRGVVADMQKQLPNYNFSYAHNLNPRAIVDLIPTINSKTSKAILDAIDMRQRILEGDNAILVNTWVGSYEGIYPQHNPRFISHCDIYRECYKLLNNYYNLNLELNPDVWNYVPNIEYSSYNTHVADEFLSNAGTVNLFCNGEVLSTQSSMGNMENIVNKLASTYPNETFVVTSKINALSPNIKFTGDIFNVPCDLCEISYLSSKINVIVGKNSGPFTYATTKNNLLDANKKFICFGHRIEDTLINGLDFPAKYEFSNTTDDQQAIDFYNKVVKGQ